MLHLNPNRHHENGICLKFCLIKEAGCLQHFLLIIQTAFRVISLIFRYPTLFGFVRIVCYCHAKKQFLHVCLYAFLINNASNLNLKKINAIILGSKTRRRLQVRKEYLIRNNAQYYITFHHLLVK